MPDTIRPKDETVATEPAADDAFLLDSASKGTRSLPATYFTSRYALAATCKPLVAGTGITLTNNPDGTVTISLT